MLTFFSNSKQHYCDGVSRRNFLRLGAMGMGGLTLAGLLRAEAQAGITNSTKSVINIHLGGGPSHQDMFDLKPDAPTEFRGEFNPIPTNVPGMEICEHFPKLAKMADKYSVIRSLIGMYDDHSDFHTQTGFGRKDLKNVGGRPSFGSVVSKVLGPAGSGAPPFISFSSSEAGFLGPVYKPYKPQGGGDLRLTGGLNAERLGSRTSLLASLDSIRRDVDATGQMAALDTYTERAVGVVTSGRVADALDLGKEDRQTRARYGEEGNSFLTARRLVEAGVRVVTFQWGGWDTHSGNFTHLKKQLPKLDVAMSALLQDLSDRGLEKDTTIVMWGEFGRTPRVNSTAGRDHWSRVSLGFLAGGGMRNGQVIGSSTKNAEEAKDRPVHLLDVFATLYHNMGIDPGMTIRDPNGRPQYIVEHHHPIKELV